jgi:two-component system CheB/CheR fusion protein
VVSGTGSDGAPGVRAIKDEGGMVIVQNPASTGYDGMRRSALATGLVDYELPSAEMPAQIIDYVAHAFGKPPPACLRPGAQGRERHEEDLRPAARPDRPRISQYEPSTVHRRIERRMAVHQIESMDGYVKYAQQMRRRWRHCFNAVVERLPGAAPRRSDPGASLLAPGGNIRFSGTTVRAERARGVLHGQGIGRARPGDERDARPGHLPEAYSLAILLEDLAAARGRAIAYRIFATGRSPAGIVTAQAGVYGYAAVHNVRLKHIRDYFTQAGESYTIVPALRDCVDFSVCDLLDELSASPPPSIYGDFDLIVCCNLLFYYRPDIRQRTSPSWTVMDGLKALHAIRSEDALKRIPVIAVTASAMKGNREEILAHGFDGYISKPIDAVVLENDQGEALWPRTASRY